MKNIKKCRFLKFTTLLVNDKQGEFQKSIFFFIFQFWLKNCVLWQKLSGKNAPYVNFLIIHFRSNSSFFLNQFLAHSGHGSLFISFKFSPNNWLLYFSLILSIQQCDLITDAFFDSTLVIQLHSHFWLQSHYLNSVLWFASLFDFIHII